jgi:hypothetical protein
MLEHGSFLFGVPELFRCDFFPLVVLFDTVTLNTVISSFFGLFKRSMVKHTLVYGDTNGQSKNAF